MYPHGNQSTHTPRSTQRTAQIRGPLEGIKNRRLWIQNRDQIPAVVNISVSVLANIRAAVVCGSRLLDPAAIKIVSKLEIVLRSGWQPAPGNDICDAILRVPRNRPAA